MNNKKYVKRLAENKLNKLLHSAGCVLINGPKFCGKTTLCEQYAKSITSLKTINQIQLIQADPRLALAGESPHLIDEWQKVPELWDLIKDELDKNYIFGKFILTGSTTPINPKLLQHSGAGRIARFTLKPFTLFESGESNGEISLSKLFESDSYFKSFLPKENDPRLSDIAHYICRGGWPISIIAEKEYSLDVTKQYFNGLFTIENESDDFAALLEGKNIDLLKLILKSYARNISTEAKSTAMINDILESGIRNTLEWNTFESYQNILKSLYIIYDMPAKNFNLRSSVAVRTSPVHHFIDTSIATAALGITPEDLLNDLNSFGLFFEDFVIRDLSVYSESIDGELKHYRDSSGQEVDAIIELPNGDYCAIEIKIASEKNIEKGINSLISFERKIKNGNQKLPKFKMIITSHGGCYKKDDIYIVPITYLKN